MVRMIPRDDPRRDPATGRLRPLACPICQELFHPQGLLGHIRNKHNVDPGPMSTWPDDWQENWPEELTPGHAVNGKEASMSEQEIQELTERVGALEEACENLEPLRERIDDLADRVLSGADNVARSHEDECQGLLTAQQQLHEIVEGIKEAQQTGDGQEVLGPLKQARELKLHHIRELGERIGEECERRNPGESGSDGRPLLDRMADKYLL